MATMNSTSSFKSSDRLECLLQLYNSVEDEPTIIKWDVDEDIVEMIKGLHSLRITPEIKAKNGRKALDQTKHLTLNFLERYSSIPACKNEYSHTDLVISVMVNDEKFSTSEYVVNNHMLKYLDVLKTDNIRFETSYFKFAKFLTYDSLESIAKYIRFNESFESSLDYNKELFLEHSDTRIYEYPKMPNILVKVLPEHSELLLITGEFYIGTRLRSLRKIIPHFMTCLGMVKINNRRGIVYEKAEGYSLCKFLESDPTPEEILNVMSQVVLALSVAYKEMGFMHGDLNSHNVLLQDLDREISITYPTAIGDISIKTSRLVLFIDYGESQINDDMGRPIIINTKACYKGDNLMFPMKDIFKIAANMSFDTVDTNTYELFDFFITKPTPELRGRIFNNYAIMPAYEKWMYVSHENYFTWMYYKYPKVREFTHIHM